MNRRLLLALACLAGLACADNTNDEAVGNLAVRVTTTGTADPNGYTLSLEGQPDRAMASNDTTYYFGIPIGDYNVTLAGAEIGCTVQDGATKAKYVAIGNNELAFIVNCP